MTKLSPSTHKFFENLPIGIYKLFELRQLEPRLSRSTIFRAFKKLGISLTYFPSQKSNHNFCEGKFFWEGLEFYLRKDEDKT